MKDSERELGLKVTGLFIAVKADSDRMVPASRGDSPAVVGTLVTEALSAGPAVVLRELDAELLPAAMAVQDLVVRDPVCRPGCILHQTCVTEGNMTGDTHGTQHPSPTGRDTSGRHFTGSQSNHTSPPPPRSPSPPSTQVRMSGAGAQALIRACPLRSPDEPKLQLN